MCTKKQNWTGLDIYTGIYNDTQLHTYGTCRWKEMYWPTTEHENDMDSAHMKYSIHMHVHEEKDRETHCLNLEMNRTVWKNFLSLLAAALVLKEFCVTDQEGWNRTCWEHYIHRGIKVFLKTISIWGQNVDGLWPRGGLPFRFNNQRHLAVKMHNWSFTDVNSCHFVYDGEFQSYIITNSVCSA